MPKDYTYKGTVTGRFSSVEPTTISSEKKKQLFVPQKEHYFFEVDLSIYDPIPRIKVTKES